MKAEIIPPKPPPDVTLTMTMEEAQILRSLCMHDSSSRFEAFFRVGTQWQERPSSHELSTLFINIKKALLSAGVKNVC